MLDKKTFAAMRKQLEAYDKSREELIKSSRDILKLSKGAIYSLHRTEHDTALQQLNQAKTVIRRLKELLAQESRLAGVGAYNEALEEYVEASCYYHFLTQRTLPTPQQLGVTADVYLPGVCDTVGELVRKAINSAIKKDYKTALEIREFVTEIYEELMLFDFPNSPVRRKFDAIKYGLEKLEDLALQLQLKKKT